MANPKSNIYTVPLNGPLETDNYNGGIKSFQGFNEKNAFFRNNALTPFYKKEQTSQSGAVADNEGNIYYIKNNKLVKKDIEGTETNLLDTSYGLKKELVLNKPEVKAFFSPDYYVYSKPTTSSSGTYSTYCIHTPLGEIEQSITGELGYISIIVKNGYFAVSVNTELKIYRTSDNSVVYNFYDTCYQYSKNIKLSVINNYIVLFYYAQSTEPYSVKSVNNYAIWFNTTNEAYGTSSLGFEFIVDNTFEYEKKVFYNTYSSNKYYACSLKIDSDSAGVTVNQQYAMTPTTGTFSYIAKKDFLDRNMFVRASITQRTIDSNYYAFPVLQVGGVVTKYAAVDVSGSSPDFQLGATEPLYSFRMLFNNGVFSGISTTAGKLLTEWFSVDAFFEIRFDFYNNRIYYKDNYGCIYKISVVNNVDVRIENNIVITNSNTKLNAYDIKNNKAIELFSDFNNRCVPESDSVEATSSISYSTYKSACDQYFVVSAQNALFELQEPYPSLLLNPQSVYINRVDAGQISIVSSLNYQADFFIGTSAGDCKYYDKAPYVESTLQDTTYPIDTTGNILYSPNVFSKFISSYINQDMIINDGVGYPLVYNNQKLIFGYYLLSEVENIENMFNIQGQAYGIADNKIFSYSYSSGVISGISTIADITNYQFIGNTTQQAYFWNKVDKSIYTFTGANILSKFSEAYKFGDIVTSAFDVTTQTVFIVTAESVYLLNEQLCELKVPGVVSVYPFLKGFIFLTSDKAYYYSYVSETGFNSEPLVIETCFFGAGDNVLSINDTLYLRLYNANKSDGLIELKVTTITNEEVTTEATTIKISAADWDNKTNSVYLRYQPKKQRGLGSSFAIISPFAIAYLGIGNTVDTILIDKLSKGSINAPAVTNNDINF